MKGRSIPYSAKELAWLEARKEAPRRELHAKFCVKFRRDDVSLKNLKAMLTRKGWKTGRTGCFVKGQVGITKGIKRPFNAGSAKTQFKKGGLPHNYQGAGHERICKKDGYVTIITADTNPHTGADTRPVLKHKHLWEQANGTVPDGYFLKCLDGDRTNCDPSNWKAMPRSTLPRLSGGRWHKPYQDYAPEVRPTILAVAELEHIARQVRK